MPILGAQQPKKGSRTFKDISHYFLSAAEADATEDATGTADHLEVSHAPKTSDNKPASSKSPSQPVRRKENCASCAHLITRAGQPFQCRIFSLQHADYGVARREKIDLHEGHTCPYFTRITSRQIKDILRSHGSSLSSEQVREYAHSVEEQLILNKSITLSPRGGLSAEEILREELLRHLEDGYCIIDATVTKKEDHSEARHSKTTIRKVRLRVKQDD